MNSLSLRPTVESRAQALQRLANESFQILVIGGGITGCGIARDAALRGLKVAQIEARDIGAGTSCKSTKLVHGGLRYLEHGELKLVFESVNERLLLMRLARHLVRPISFMVPHYRGDRRWLLTLDLGLWIYDALSLGRGNTWHRAHFARATLGLEPTLRREGLSGSIVYTDCVTDDARLCVENAMDARALGAAIATHVRGLQLTREGDGSISGANVEDTESGASFHIRAKVVVNAAGPWCDEIRALAGEPPILRPTKGAHLVVDAARLPTRYALLMQSPVDGRAVFTIPWGLGRTLVGTTDTFYEGSPDDCNADRNDVSYLLATANSYYPDARLTTDDVVATYAGLRPIVRPSDSDKNASDLSREDALFGEPGFISIAGGKLTTYRRMASKVVDVAAKQLGIAVESSTSTRPLGGANGIERSDDDFARLPSLIASATPKVASNLAATYGTRAQAVWARTATDRSAAAPLDSELPFVMAQVDEAVEFEFARSLDDVLARRMQLLLRAHDQALGIAPAVAARMGHLLGWTPAQVDAQVSRYREKVGASRAFRT